MSYATTSSVYSAIMVSTSCFVNALVHRSNQARISWVLSAFPGAAFFVCARTVSDASAIEMKVSNINRFILFIFIGMMNRQSRREGGEFYRDLFLTVRCYTKHANAWRLALAANVPLDK